MRLLALRHIAVAWTAALALSCWSMEAQDTGGKVSHRVGLDVRGAWLTPGNKFFRGENERGTRLNKSGSMHLQYSFTFPSGSRFGSLYPTAYQGAGISWNTFFDKSEIGVPAAIYVFQGAQIARLGDNLSLDYEWNFGASFGWHPHNEANNSWNTVVGSRINAYINASFMLSWHPVPELTISGGVDVSHFSNGNTKYPNAGVNTLGARAGAVYSIGNGSRQRTIVHGKYDMRHSFLVDVVLYGAARSKGIMYEDSPYILGGKFGIAGLNVTPMYRVSRCFQAGMSIDVQYDESANITSHVAGKVYTDDGTELRFFRPPLREQISAGLSLRAELVMPIFTVGIGFGHNVIYKGDDLDGFYQIVALKASVSRHAFIHIGYKLSKFHDPNNLMLGAGWRFGSKKLFSLHNRQVDI